jgi:hypothetical protein
MDCPPGVPWPCGLRRSELLAEIAEHGSSYVFTLLTDLYFIAIEERPDVSPRAFYEQIVQWAVR